MRRTRETATIISDILFYNNKIAKEKNPHREINKEPSLEKK